MFRFILLQYLFYCSCANVCDKIKQNKIKAAKSGSVLQGYYL